MNDRLKIALNWSGTGLALVGVVFVGIRLSSYWGQLDTSQLTVSVWVSIAALSLLYGLANLMLISGWNRLLLQFGFKATWAWAVRIYGVSQLAKYVPGNIFHLAGRQALGLASGAPSSALIKSSLWEIGMIASAGLMYGWLALPVVLPIFPPIIGILMLPCTVWLAARVLGKLIGKNVAAALLFYVLFHFASALIFITILNSIVGKSSYSLEVVMSAGGAYIVAWLIGLITPGAPAGVGIREFVLLILLKGLVPDAELLLAVLLGRVVTVFGDILLFLGSSTMRSSKPSS